MLECAVTQHHQYLGSWVSVLWNELQFRCDLEQNTFINNNHQPTEVNRSGAI
jgi:hypothetical protein